MPSVGASSRFAWVPVLIVAVCLFLGVAHGHALEEHISLLEQPGLISGVCLVLCSVLLSRRRGLGSGRLALARRPLALAGPGLPPRAHASLDDRSRASPSWLQRFLA